MSFKTVLNQKMGKSIVFDGYMYHFHKLLKRRKCSRYFCAKRGSEVKCKATMKIYSVDKVEIGIAPHTCDRLDSIDFEMKNVRLAIRSHVELTPGEKTANVIGAQHRNAKSLELKQRIMEKSKTLARSTQLYKKKAGAPPPEPKSLKDLHITDKRYTCLLGNEEQPFLMYDSRDDDRMLIFSTKAFLGEISRGKKFASDGTFKIVPGLFYQLYIIRVQLERPDRTWWLSAIYILLRNKTKRTYTRLIQKVCDLCHQNGFAVPEPEFWMLDFEQTVIEAILENFPNCEVKGCLFHMQSNTQKHAQENGLRPRYRDEVDFRKFVGKFAALAFLPVHEVRGAFIDLYFEDPNDADKEMLLDYFGRYYVLGTVSFDRVNGHLQMVRHEPMFPPCLWNQHDSTLLGRVRTNNHAEGQNNRLNSRYGGGRGVYALIQFLQMITDEDMTHRVNFLNNRVMPDKSRLQKYQNQNLNLINDIMDYHFGRKTINEFLSQVGHRMRLSKVENKIRR